MAHPIRSALYLIVPLTASASLLGCTEGDAFVTAKGSALHQATGCEDLLAQIQADARAKLDEQVAFYQNPAMTFRGVSIDDGESNLGYDGGGQPDAPSAGGDDQGSGGETPPSDSPDDYSETNTQVEGVDEADVVKTDGERIYLFHGDQFFIVDAWPADETRVLGSVQVEGSGFEMFVENGKAVLYSLVYPADGVAGGKADNEVKPAYDCGGCYGGPNFTKVSVYDVTGTQPSLEREFLFEGYYVSGRRHGDVVRTVIQGGFKAPNLYSPIIEYYDSFGNELSQARINEQLERWRDDTMVDIEATSLEDWVPRRFEKKSDEWVALEQGCDGYFVPEPGRVHEGVTQVVTFDAREAKSPDVVAVLGGAETVYANHSVLILGQTDYTFTTGGIDTTQTLLHQFRLKGDETEYEASGFVPGYLHNQFSLDEQAGVIRVSTTAQVRSNPEADFFNFENENRVYTLSEEEAELQVMGKTAAFGEPGEQIFATRFMGDRGYVVTFRQTDPLIVVDLSDAKDPTVLGELHIPGFSDYIHPLSEDMLLTIGQDADENGVQSGVALQIFDVSDSSSPALLHKMPFGGFSYSEAQNNHKAFTFVSDYFSPGVGLLLFPITTYDADYRSSLEVVKVSGIDGFELLGSIDHAELLLQNCPVEASYDGYCHYAGSDMRRGIQIEEFIYAISYGGLTVHNMDDLAGTVQTVELPSPTYGDIYYGGRIGGGDDGGLVDPGVPSDPTDGMGGQSSL